MEEDNKISKQNSDDLDENGKDIGDSDDASDFSDKIPKEVLDELPKEVRHFMFSREQNFRSVGSPHDSLMDKINEDHISKLLELNDQELKHEHDNQKSSRLYQLIYSILAILFLVFLVIFYREDTEILMRFVSMLALFGGGFGTGYGLKTYKDKNK